jgi:serine/threonine protein phosphatase PrpC
MGQSALGHPAGTLWADRYLVWQGNIWLDTQPELPVAPLEKLPESVLLYLRLSDLTQHLPRPYYYLQPQVTGLAEPVLLLDMAPIAVGVDNQNQIHASLLPSLLEEWNQASALRQLCWLQQIATLWSPLDNQQVAASLLDLSQLRVDQALLRLTTLVTDDRVNLSDLGSSWESLVKTAHPDIQVYLHRLCSALGSGQLVTPEALVEELDQALNQLVEGLTVSVDWVAYTDQGPSRDRNEDACYPQGQAYQQQLAGERAAAPLPLLMICDGIGGHEQGNVASQTAIEVLLKELQPLADEPQLTPGLVTQRMKQAIALANTEIVNRNDSEQRAARARMGTTVVLALVHFPYVSIAHLGDSRAYRISRQTCYQLTVDDDVAAREARLGYALYQEALHLPGAGALIQALGINDNGYLYPTVQHCFLDEASAFLLCSDGLSDNDRVEMLWPHIVQPLVNHQRDLEAVGQELVQQANRLNGHDNVTVGLLRLTPLGFVSSPLPGDRIGQHRPPLEDATVPSNLHPEYRDPAPQPATTQLVAPSAPVEENSKARVSLWGRLLPFAVVALLGIVAAGLLNQLRQPKVNGLRSITPGLPLAGIQGQSFYANFLALVKDVEIGSFWQVSASTAGQGPQPLVLMDQPTANPVSATSDNAMPLLTAGSILKVVNRQTLADGTDWVRLQVCSIPAGVSFNQVPSESDQPPASEIAADTLSRRLASPGDTGLLQEQWLYGAASSITVTTTEQLGDCEP